MRGVRIRWRGVARVAAIVLVAMLGVRLLPGLLRAPEPPPLGADVGLPKAKPVRVARKPERTPHPPKSIPDAPAATAKIGTRIRHRPKPRPPKPKSKPKPSPPPEPTPPPAPEYVPTPAPQAIPQPVPEPPSTPGDGSQEF